MTKYFIILFVLIQITLLGQRDSLGIVFNKGKSTINFKCSRLDKVDTLLKKLADNPTWIIEIDINGVEIEGSEKTNAELKGQRLRTINNLLVGKGIHQQRIVARPGDHGLIILSEDEIKVFEKLKKTDECEYMKRKYPAMWKLLSTDFIEIK